MARHQQNISRHNLRRGRKGQPDAVGFILQNALESLREHKGAFDGDLFFTGSHLKNL